MQNSAKEYDLNLLSEDNIRKYVLGHYALQNAQIEQIKFKDTNKQRAVFKITTANASYCLKKVYFSKDILFFVYSAIEWFYRHNINVPKIISTIDNNRFVEYENMYFILTAWIKGEKCNYDIRENIINSAKNLALMHKVSKDFYPINGSIRREGFDNLNTSLSKHFKQILLCSNNAFKYGDKFSKAYLSHFENNQLLAKLSVDVSSTIKLNNLGVSLCHLDYVNKNILFDSSKRLWVIDFDNCQIDYSVHDIAYFLRRILKRNTTSWDTKLTIDCLNCYEKIHPLSFDEYKYIYSYLVFPQKFWRISRDYYNNLHQCNENSFLTLLNNYVKNEDKMISFGYEFGKYIEDKFKMTII